MFWSTCQNRVLRCRVFAKCFDRWCTCRTLQKNGCATSLLKSLRVESSAGSEPLGTPKLFHINHVTPNAPRRGFFANGAPSRDRSASSHPRGRLAEPAIDLSAKKLFPSNPYQCDNGKPYVARSVARALDVGPFRIHAASNLAVLKAGSRYRLFIITNSS